jgi:hypothetical protein
MLRTNGVYMQWQESAARWCYHNADPDYGRFQVQAPRKPSSTCAACALQTRTYHDRSSPFNADAQAAFSRASSPTPHLPLHPTRQARQLTTALKEHLKGAGVSISHSSAKCQVEVCGLHMKKI